MRNPLLPKAQAGFLDGAGRPLAEWRRFFESLSALTTEATVQGEIGEILSRIAALEAEGSGGSVLGTDSIKTFGDLATGITARLVGDSGNPGASHYYGTDAAGAKGFHALPLVPDLAVPYFVPAGESYTVAANKQALWKLPTSLGLGASLNILGALEQVD